MTRPRSLVAAILALIVATGACAAADPIIRGVVVDVRGDLVEIEQFTVLTGDGERLDLVPAPDVLFHGGAPLNHLDEHLRTGDPIEITYQVLDDGTNVATAIADVGGG